MGNKLCPKVILEGTRLTFKTEITFELNEHPRVVGPAQVPLLLTIDLGGVVYLHELSLGARTDQFRAIGRSLAMET